MAQRGRLPAGSVAAATEAALKAAPHLTAADRGAVEALRVLARRIDALSGSPDGSEEAPKFDNVTIPTFLKFCESLGLTPAGRKALGEKKESTGGTLGKLRAVPRPRSA